MNARWKNAIGVIILIIVSATIIAGAVFSAVESKEKGVEKELFLDVAPVDYSAEENMIYAKRFRDAIASYFAPVTTEMSLGDFADKVLNACSLARIPAYKLDRMAQVIKRYDVGELQNALANGSEITEEQVQKLFEKENPAFIAEILHSFFAETGLTGEEFGNFVYQYLINYASADYKSALALVGKDVFTEFVGATAYFLSQMKDYSEHEGRLADAYAFEAAAYQMGSVFVATANSAPAATVEKALGFAWSYDPTLTNYAELTVVLNELKGKFFTALLITGEIMRSVRAESLDEATDDTGFILSRISLAKDIKRGLDNYIARYGSDTDLNLLKATFSAVVDDIYYAFAYVAGGDTTGEAFVTALNNVRAHYEDFFASLIYLDGLDLSAVDIDSASEADKNALLIKAQKLSALNDDATFITESLLYLWGSSRLYELKKEG